MNITKATSSRAIFRAVLAAAVVIALFPAGAGAATPAPIELAGKAIPDSYLVTLAPSTSDVAAVARSIVRTHGGEVGHIYTHALKGFSIHIDHAGVVDIARDPRVTFIEQDPAIRAVGSQSNPPYGLDRIDQRDLPLNSTYS